MDLSTIGEISFFANLLLMVVASILPLALSTNKSGWTQLGSAVLIFFFTPIVYLAILLLSVGGPVYSEHSTPMSESEIYRVALKELFFCGVYWLIVLTLVYRYFRITSKGTGSPSGASVL